MTVYSILPVRPVKFCQLPGKKVLLWVQATFIEGFVTEFGPRSGEKTFLGAVLNEGCVNSVHLSSNNNINNNNFVSSTYFLGTWLQTLRFLLYMSVVLNFKTYHVHNVTCYIFTIYLSLVIPIRLSLPKLLFLVSSHSIKIYPNLSNVIIK